MELIDEGLFDYSESANELGNLIIKFSKNLKSNQSFESYISYEEFENLIRSFINDVMCYYLKRINVSREVLVLVFDYWFSGAFLETGNGIVIQSEIMESIYKGNIEYLSVVFHELVHFQVYCDINYRKIVNEDTVRILKEKLITKGYEEEKASVLSYIIKDEDDLENLNQDNFDDIMLQAINFVEDLFLYRENLIINTQIHMLKDHKEKENIKLFINFMNWKFFFF